MNTLRQRISGTSLIELVIVTPVLMLLGLGTVQGALLYHAKSTLNYATFEAARKGAVTHAQKQEMKKELGIRLGPIFGGSGEAEDALKALMTASMDVKMPMYTKVKIINPTSEAFDDWGTLNPESGKIEIPNSHLRHRDSERVPGATSGVTLQDANLLKIEVKYGYKMSVPLAANLFSRVMSAMDPGNAQFYLSGRIPLTSVATVRMQSPAQQDGNINVAANFPEGNTNSTELVNGLVSSAVTLCDPNGISQDLDNTALDSLLGGSNEPLFCSGPAILGSSSGGSSLLPSGASSGNQSSFTDCS